jgi:8-oxo-dGTP pyrophosphatase MutT (NUDIX family)
VERRTFARGEVLEVPVDGRLRAALGAHLERDVAQPVAPRYAATVMLVRGGRPTADPLEVFMLRRAATMAFVPDAVVFPGGRVDERDADAGLPWAGPTARQWASRLGCDEATARCVVVAAAREVFEETGILLAGPDEHSVVGDLRDGGWSDDRARLASHEASFAGVLAGRGLVLRTDLLGLRSRWLTPEFEPKRYDTFFFAALVPAGQIPDAETSEAVAGRWVRPEQVLEEGDAGRLLLLPPTAYNLTFLAGAGGAEGFVFDTPRVERIMLAPTVTADGGVVLSCVLP